MHADFRARHHSNPLALCAPRFKTSTSITQCLHPATPLPHCCGSCCHNLKCGEGAWNTRALHPFEALKRDMQEYAFGLAVATCMHPWYC
jgi:hypothetical protein